MKLLQQSLLAEVEQQLEDNDNYPYQFKNAITSYWDMFSHGLTIHSVFCNVCGTEFEKENPFAELILYFDDSHHTDNKKGNACTLGELLENYNRREDVIYDYDCNVCKMKTQATVRNRVRCYPRVLCIALSRGSYLDHKHSIIQTSVDFPLENFNPNEHSLNEDHDDDTTYNLVATINHKPIGQNGGHYTAICKQHDSGVWYFYNDAEVQRSNFSKIQRGVRKVKVDVQRAATLLFYIRREPIQVDTSIVNRVDDNDDGSTNSTEKLRGSNFSYIANDDTINNSNAHNEDDNNDDRHIEQNITTGLDQDQVCVSLFSAPIIIPYRHFTTQLTPLSFSAVLLLCRSVCTSRRLQMYYI